MVSELLFDHLLDAVHVDLEGADPGRLSDLRDVLHVPDIEGRADVDHGPLPLVGPDVRGRVEDLEPVEVPPERGHVRLDLNRRFVEGDEQAGFVLTEPLEQEVRREDRLAAPGGPGDDVRSGGQKAAVQHRVEAHDARLDAIHRKPAGPPEPLPINVAT